MKEALKHFKDLMTWRIAHQLVLEVYRASARFPQVEKFVLVSQMNRSALSITSNIAEGFGRESYKEKAHFYVMAKGSLHELENQIMLAYDLSYISEDVNRTIIGMITSNHKLLNALIKKTRDIQGKQTRLFVSKF